MARPSAGIVGKEGFLVFQFLQDFRLLQVPLFSWKKILLENLWLDQHIDVDHVGISTGVALLLDQRARTCKTPWQWKASQLPGAEHHHDIAAPQATDARYLSTLQCLENLETWFSKYYIKNTPQKHGHWMPLNDHTIHSSHSIHSHVVSSDSLCTHKLLCTCSS